MAVPGPKRRRANARRRLQEALDESLPQLPQMQWADDVELLVGWMAEQGTLTHDERNETVLLLMLQAMTHRMKVLEEEREEWLFQTHYLLGTSWERLGQALGVSAQATHHKYAAKYAEWASRVDIQMEMEEIKKEIDKVFAEIRQAVLDEQDKQRRKAERAVRRADET